MSRNPWEPADSQDALDALDEARRGVKTFEAGLWWGGVGALAATALAVGGGVVQALLPFLSIPGIVMVAFGGVGFGSALLFAMFWIVGHYLDKESPYQERGRAQKLYNRAVRRDAERSAS